MARKAPKTDTLRRLFSLSGNHCAFPGCRHVLVKDNGNFVGQICHIEAAEKGGERFNPKQTDEQRRAFENLVLFCYDHHQETNDTTKFTVRKLKAIKRAHEKQYLNASFPISEEQWSSVLPQMQETVNKILQVSEDTNNVVHDVKKQLDDLMRISLGLAGKNDHELYLEQLDSIQELKKQNKHWSAIELLQNFKETNWNKISEEAKYKVLVRLGTIYLELNEIRKASQTLWELKNLNVNKDDQFALLAVASAGLGKKEEFHHYFILAKERTPENINLWVAYINFYGAEKQTEEIINEIPAAIKNTSEIKFSLSAAYYLHNDREKGLQCLRQSLEAFQGSEQSKADLKFVLGTRLLMPHNFIDKIIYNHYTEQDKAELQEALRLFTDAWDSIKLTEIAKTKWHILLNRGVVYKILGDKNAALLDFSYAYELSGNAGAFENLVILLFNMGQLARADELINKFPVETASDEEKLDILAFKIRSLHLQDRTKEAVDLLASTSHEDSKKEQNKYSLIIAMLLEKNEYEQAFQYTASFKEKFPNDPDGYILAGTILLLLKRNDEARQELIHAIPRLHAGTPINQKYEIASGLIKLENFTEAAEILEQIVDWNIWNEFSKGLIYAWHMSGNIQKALTYAKLLYEKNPGEPFLAEIILRVYEETKFLNKAIETGESFLPNANGKVKTFFLLHIANLYFKKKDWSNARKYCNAIENVGSLSMDDQFRLAFLIVKTGDTDKGLELAYLARNRFYNASDAHAKFITVVMQVKGDPNSIFPDTVKNECAVVLQDITGQQTTFIVTANLPTIHNEVSNTDEFAKSLLGKKVGQEVLLNKAYSSTKLTIKEIVDKIAFAFRESTDLFYTRFANNRNNIQVFRAIPGHPDDQMEEVIRELSLSGQSYRKQLYALYNAGALTIGMAAGLLKLNIVFQFLEITTSSDIFLHSYHHDHSRIYNKAIRSNIPIILDITALLTICMLLPDFDLLDELKNTLIVAQSVIDELQDFYDEMESAASNGYMSVGYEHGAIAKYQVAKEEIQKDRTNVLSAITWCKANAHVATPNLIGINRAVRTRNSDMLGEYAYHTILLAKENGGIVLSDDGIFRELLFNDGGIESISIYQLALCTAEKRQITERQFIDLTLQLIKANYIFIPPTEDCLWNSFEAAGFQIRRPFEAAAHGLLVMSSEYCIYHSVKFLKKLCIEAGLSTTRKQISLYIFQVVARRKDFNHIKERMIAYIQSVFALLPRVKDELISLVTSI